MGLIDQKTLKIVLQDGADGQAPSSAGLFSTVQSLLEKGYSVAHKGSLADPGATPAARPTLVVRSKKAAAPESLNIAADPSPSSGLRYADLDGQDGEPRQILDQVEAARAELGAVRPGEWKPWFPVIDYDRCTNCMQCLSFCLFGVYGVDSEQKIQVQNHDNCKTNCPACSRVCPEAAIMFPKYKAGPINGDRVSDADLQREKMKVDISALLGGDIYQMLRDRSDKAKSRFSKERDSEKALKERQKCLVKLQQMGDIPAEVLMSLPSPEEIQRRAEEAKNRAKSALTALENLQAKPGAASPDAQ